MVRGDFEQAAAGFRRTIDIDPNWTWGYVKLARTLAHQKKCPEALAQAEIAERKNRGRRRAAVAVVAGRHLRAVRRDGARARRSSTSSTPWRRSSTSTR